MAPKDTDERKGDDKDDDQGLDMSQTAVKKMIAEARERGYITYDQLNTVLPPEQVRSEQIEDVMSMLSEMGINDHRGRRRPKRKSQGRRSGHDDRVVMLSSRRPKPKSWTAPTTRCACTCAKWARRTAVPRRRDCHRQADRSWPQDDDPGPLRKPADFPGDYDLARGTSERRHPAARRHRP